MLALTKPKLLFCDAGIIVAVRLALQQLQMPIPVFTFGGKVDGARVVDDLFTETGYEKDFMYAKLKINSDRH